MPPSKPVARRSIRERSGIATSVAAKIRPVEVTFDWRDGSEPLTVVVDLATFTIAEDAAWRQAVARRFVPRDADGKALGSETMSQRFVALGWVVARRTHDLDFDELVDTLPRDGISIRVVEDAGGVESPEASGAGSGEPGRRSPRSTG